jgi:hypothetical protein
MQGMKFIGARGFFVLVREFIDKPIQTDVPESRKQAGYTCDQDSLNAIL